MLAIYRKDLKSQYTGMSGWIVTAFTLFILGLYFIVHCVYSGYSVFPSVLSDSLFIFLALVPLLTMRSITEERRQKTDQALRSRAFRGGAYTTVVCAVCTAFAVAVNLFVGALPTTWTRIDLSDNQVFSLSDETIRLCESVDKDITMYYLCGSGGEDLAVYELLQKYEALSPHITLVEKDPVLYPTFASAYDASSASLGSVIVDGGDKYKVVDSEGFYESVFDYDTYSYVTSFAGERALTTAILLRDDRRLRLYLHSRQLHDRRVYFIQRQYPARV